MSVAPAGARREFVIAGGGNGVLGADVVVVLGAPGIEGARLRALVFPGPCEDIQHQFANLGGTPVSTTGSVTSLSTRA